MQSSLHHSTDSYVEFDPAIATTRHPDGATIGFRVARREDVSRIHAIMVRDIGPGVADLRVMQKIYQHDSESQWVILRAEPATTAFRIVGCYCALYLNQTGVERLDAGVLDTRCPDLSALARPDERPAQIYIWAMVARKLVSIIAPLIVQSFPKARYAGVPIAARAGTIGGLKSGRSYKPEASHRTPGAVGDVFDIDLARTPVGARVRELEQRQ